jgi:formylmethanofuran dehydrogenase subunit E
MRLDAQDPAAQAFIADHVPEAFRPYMGRPKSTHITCENCEERFLRADIDHTRSAYLCFPCSEKNPPEGDYLDARREWGTWR